MLHSVEKKLIRCLHLSKATYRFLITMKLLDQLKQRREQLGLRQEDMELRIGMKRQQYQRLESDGNPRLSTLDLVAQGLEGEILFIPQERLRDVLAVLQQAQGGQSQATGPHTTLSGPTAPNDVPEIDDPWAGILD
jgi:transcriptional regulator with XRE-family HTH domain